MSVQITFDIERKEWLGVMASVHALRNADGRDENNMRDLYEAVEVIEVLAEQAAKMFGVESGTVEYSFVANVREAVRIYKNNFPNRKS